MGQERQSVATSHEYPIWVDTGGSIEFSRRSGVGADPPIRWRSTNAEDCPIGDIAWCCRSLSSWKAVAGDLPRPFTFQSGAALGLESRSARLLLGQADSR